MLKLADVCKEPVLATPGKVHALLDSSQSAHLKRCLLASHCEKYQVSFSNRFIQTILNFYHNTMYIELRKVWDKLATGKEAVREGV